MIVRASMLAAMLAQIGAQPATAQPVPEGVHRPGTGRPTLCGSTARTVAALQAELAGRLPPLAGSDRYIAFEDAPNLRIWTFTTAAHPAHPAVACRTLIQRSDGGFEVGTEIYCFSGRENCDGVYREFEELNAQVRREMERVNAPPGRAQ
ncbi:MAG: hypothetical protein QOD42_1233 [Sphingomonadales bacterium]|jgi:hypothetical protein|nr:hypothetical protein [Sphingomonadales bacterium]